jgi:hypothetical protein
MKKTLFILLLIIASVTVKAQTKEETIAWLKEKLTNYLTGDLNIKLQSITECDFVISFYHKNPVFPDLNGPVTCTFPTNINSFDNDGGWRYNNKL